MTSTLDCHRRELPEGPYLLGLRTLLMPGHRMQRLPPALATARSLEVGRELLGKLVGIVGNYWPCLHHNWACLYYVTAVGPLPVPCSCRCWMLCP